MAIPRTLGPIIQARAQALRRQAMVAVAELRGPTAAVGSYPVAVDVIRRNPTGPASSASGLTTAWTETVFADLVGHVRYNGRWRLRGTDTEVELRDDQRIAMVADLPSGGGAGADRLLVTDRLRFDDDTYGTSVWRILEIRDRAADGLCWALCEWAREEGVE